MRNKKEIENEYELIKFDTSDKAFYLYKNGKMISTAMIRTKILGDDER